MCPLLWRSRQIVGENSGTGGRDPAGRRRGDRVAAPGPRPAARRVTVSPLSLCHIILFVTKIRGPVLRRTRESARRRGAERRPTGGATDKRSGFTRWPVHRRSGADDGPERAAHRQKPVRCRGSGAAISHPRMCKSHIAARLRGPRDAPAEGAGTVALTARATLACSDTATCMQRHHGWEAGFSSPPRSGARRPTRPSSTCPPRRRRRRARAST